MENDRNYDDVPSDYPYAEHFGAVAGAHPKLLLVRFQGRYYTPGNTPEQRWNDWKYSESMVEHMVAKCLESKNGKRAHMSEKDIIAQYYERTVAGNGRFGTIPQLKWTFTKVAERLGWPLPDVCK